MLIWRLFPFDGRGGFGGAVVYDTVDAVDLADAIACHADDGVGDFRPVRRDCVVGVDCAEGYHMSVQSFAVLDAGGEGVVDDCEVLPNLVAESRIFDFFTEDCVRFSQYFEFFASDFAYATHAETRAGEGLTVNDEIGETERSADFADFVFVEVAYGFDKSLETDIFGESADVVVGFDEFVLAVRTALDDVGENGALREEFDLTEFLGFVLEYADKFVADYLTFLFGVGYALESVKEPIHRVDRDEVHAELTFENFLHLFEFAFAEESVIDEYANEGFGCRLVDECRANRTVDAARKSEEDAFAFEFRRKFFKLLLDEVFVHKKILL